MIMPRLLRNMFPLLPYYLVAISLCMPARHAEATTASVKAMGMGGCAIAYPQDTLSAAWNPACAMYVGNRFDANASWQETRGEMTLHNNLFSPFPSTRYKSNVHPDVFDAEFGANYIVCGGGDVAVGLIGYNKSYIQTHYSSVIPFIGKKEQGLEDIQEVISPLLAGRLECHSFGIAVQFAGERFKTSGLENFATDVFSVEPRAVTNKGHDYSYGVGIVAGWLWNAYPGVRMGFVYESQTSMKRLCRYRGLFANFGRVKLPERFSLGFGFDFTCYLHAAIDMHLIRWSRTNWGKCTISNVLGLQKRKLGSRCGPGFGWKDQPSVRTGIDYYIPCINTVLRAGYYWTRTPIRSPDTAVNILTLETAESVVTVGATVCPWLYHEFSFCYAYGFNHTVHGNPHKPICFEFGGGTADLKNGFQFAKIGYGVTF